MTRAANLTNRMGKIAKGSNFVDKLPSPVIVSAPRTACLDTLETRAKLALKRLEPGAKAFVEGVPVMRIEARRGTKYEIYGARFTLDQCILEISHIVTERELTKNS